MGPDRKMEEDPEKTSSSERDLVMPQMMVAMGDDSSDDDDASDEEVAGPQGEGYMLLPDGDQDMDHSGNEVLDDDDSANIPPTPSSQQPPDLPVHLAKLVPTAAPPPDSATVVSFADTAESLQERRQTMAADDDIQKAMSGFTLPGVAVPPWARALGDQEWKEQLSAMIQGREEKRTEAGAPSFKDGKTRLK